MILPEKLQAKIRILPDFYVIYKIKILPVSPPDKLFYKKLLTNLAKLNKILWYKSIVETAKNNEKEEYAPSFSQREGFTG